MFISAKYELGFCNTDVCNVEGHPIVMKWFFYMLKLNKNPNKQKLIKVKYNKLKTLEKLTKFVYWHGHHISPIIQIVCMFVNSDSSWVL